MTASPQVFSELRKIKKHLLTVPDEEEWLIQKYIERPLYVRGSGWTMFVVERGGDRCIGSTTPMRFIALHCCWACVLPSPVVQAHVGPQVRHSHLGFGTSPCTAPWGACEVQAEGRWQLTMAFTVSIRCPYYGGCVGAVDAGDGRVRYLHLPRRLFTHVQ